MRPAPRVGGGVLDGSRAGRYSTLEAARMKSTRTQVFAVTVTPKPSAKSFCRTPAGRRYTRNVNETLRGEPLVPDFERRLAGALLAGGHRRVGQRRRRP